MAIFRAKILLPVVIAVFCTPIPRRIGFYKHVLNLSPVSVGLLPCQFPNGESDWGFAFEDLYGGGNGDGDGKPSNKEKRAHRNRLWGQTALVTGANSGTGYEVSLALARLGVRVTMACRNPKKCEAAKQKILRDEMVISRGDNDRGLYEAADREKYLTTTTVDTSSLASVKKFCGEFLERNGKDPLDMLFLNAGIGQRPLTPEGTNQLTEDGIEIVFATNVVGHHLMYKLLEPAIAADSDDYGPRITPARIVLTASAASYEILPFGYTLATDLDRLNGDAAVEMSHYSQSKLAQILWARELTARIDAANASGSNAEDPNGTVYVNSAHPGAVATNIWMGVVDTEREAKVEAGVGTLVTELKKSFFEWWMKSMWTPAEGALTLVYLGTAVEDLRNKDIRGKYFHPQSQEITVHQHVYANEDETNVLQAKLWKFLDELVEDFV